MAATDLRIVLTAGVIIKIKSGRLRLTMKKHVDKFFAAIVAFLSWLLLQSWLHRGGYLKLYNVANSLEMRPFVYRVLVPVLSQTLSSIAQIRAIQAIMLVLILFSVVMYYSIKYLYETFADDRRGSVVSFVGCLALLGLTFQELKVYDIPTTAFFALGLAFLARKKFIPFYILYPFATLNRETTFLLSIFYVMYYFNGPISRRHWFYGCMYQVLTYILIRLVTMAYFANHPGAPFIISSQYLFRVYTTRYLLTFIYLTFIVLLLYITLRRWNRKPSFLRAAFLIIFPLQLFLHFLMGWPYEFRVFAESLPIFSVLAMIPTVQLQKAIQQGFGDSQIKSSSNDFSVSRG